MVYDFANNHGDNRIGSIGSYHLFIRYGDIVYMEVKDVGEIVMPYDTLKKNKYWSYYYNLSHRLTRDKHLVYQHLKYGSDYHLRYQHNDDAVYPDEERFWGIDTVFLQTSLNTRDAKIVDNEAICYYKINPYDLENWDCSAQEDVEAFLMNYMYMMRAETQNNVFDRLCVIHNKIVSAYQESWMTKELDVMEKEIDELSVIFEDKKNIFTLTALNEANIINSDVLNVIYDTLMSTDGHKKYQSIIYEIGHSNKLEKVAQILSA